MNTSSYQSEFEKLLTRDYFSPNINPQRKNAFKEFLKNADGIIISFAEHNGAYTAAFKNILDWISRIETIVWYNKPMCLLATSTGKRGAKTVLEIAHARISRENKNPIPVFSLPNFNQQFDEKKGILNHDLKTEFEKVIQEFELQIDRSIQSAL